MSQPGLRVALVRLCTDAEGVHERGPVAARSQPAHSHDFRLCNDLHNRKNALFAGHNEGGRTWDRIASLIETAKLNGVKPYAHLETTLEAIDASRPKAPIYDLLPWAFKTNT